MNFRHYWATLDYIPEDKSIFWYFLWGILLGGSLVYAIFTFNFLFAVVIIIGFIFVFHPDFRKLKSIRVELTDEYIKIDDNEFKLNDYYTFSIYKINERNFLELYPKSFFKKEIHLPLPEDLVEQVREDLKKIMPESKEGPSLLTFIFRNLWH